MALVSSSDPLYASLKRPALQEQYSDIETTCDGVEEVSCNSESGSSDKEEGEPEKKQCRQLVFSVLASVVIAMVFLFLVIMIAVSHGTQQNSTHLPETTRQGIAVQTHADMNRELAAWSNVLHMQREFPTQYSEMVTARDFADTDKWTYLESLKLNPETLSLNETNWVDLVKEKGVPELLQAKSRQHMHIDNSLMTEADAVAFVEHCEESTAQGGRGGMAVFFYHGCPIGKTLFTQWKQEKKDNQATMRPSKSGRYGSGVYMTSQLGIALKYTTRGGEGNTSEDEAGVFRLLACLTKGNVAPFGETVNVHTESDNSTKKSLIKEGYQFQVKEEDRRATRFLDRASIDGQFEYHRQENLTMFVESGNEFANGIEVYVRSHTLETEFIHVFSDSHSFGGEWIALDPSSVKVQAVIWFSDD